MPDLLQYEKKLWKQGLKLVAGVDEVGRGPLAGPVVAAAVLFPAGVSLEGIKDSKKLSPRRREELFGKILGSALSVGIGMVNEKEIDQVNILNATLRAMNSAVLDLKITPQFILVDGTREIPGINVPQLAIVGGDNLSLVVASASIVAKVTRDRMMLEYDRIYPQFRFAQNKGYCTKSHLSGLRKYGPCEIHRYSFRTIRFLAGKEQAYKFKT